MTDIETDGLFGHDDSRSPQSRGGTVVSGFYLFEFVQTECLAKTRRAIRVTSGNRIGYLFFAEGSITHALTPDTFGEVAALQILRWRDGQVEQCKLHPDERARIQRPWQGLLLEAAGRDTDSTSDNLVEFPRKHTTPRPPALQREPALQHKPEEHSLQPPASRDGILGAARVDASGAILSTRGDSADLPGLAAYVVRLGELIGRELGIEQLLTLEARLTQTRCAIKREDAGALVVARAVTREPAPIDEPPQSLPSPQSPEVLVELLGSLKDVAGVLGSFVVDVAGEVLWLDLPKIFRREALTEAGTRLMRVSEAFELEGERLRVLEIRYEQYRLYVRNCERALLVVVCEANCHTGMLNMATAMLGRKLDAADVNLTHASSATGAATDSPRESAVPQGNRVQAAPGSPAIARSARPVFFRGRRVQ